MRQCKKCDKNLTKHVPKCGCEAFKVVDKDGKEYDQYADTRLIAAFKCAEKTNNLIDSHAEITVNGQRYKISAKKIVSYSAIEV